MADHTQDPLYLGDLIARLADLTGVTAVVHAVETVTKKPCGCQERREKLNEWHQRITRQRSEKTA